MALQFYIHLLPFAPKKMGFWVQKGKILKFSKFSIRLTSEALEALLCFPKGKKMFVSREELQTMILSTERPLCHVGELRYGPPKFFGGKPKIPENAFLPFESILCLYSPKWYSEAWIGLIWKHQTSLWVILGVFDRKKLIFSPKLVKNTTEKGQNQENKTGPLQSPFYCTNCHWLLSVHSICTQKWWLWAIGWVFWPKRKK